MQECALASCLFFMLVTKVKVKSLDIFPRGLFGSYQINICRTPLEKISKQILNFDIRFCHILLQGFVICFFNSGPVDMKLFNLLKVVYFAATWCTLYAQAPATHPTQKNPYISGNVTF